MPLPIGIVKKETVNIFYVFLNQFLKYNVAYELQDVYIYIHLIFNQCLIPPKLIRVQS